MFDRQMGQVFASPLDIQLRFAIIIIIDFKKQHTVQIYILVPLFTPFFFKKMICTSSVSPLDTRLTKHVPTAQSDLRSSVATALRSGTATLVFTLIKVFEANRTGQGRVFGARFVRRRILESGFAVELGQLVQEVKVAVSEEARRKAESNLVQVLDSSWRVILAVNKYQQLTVSYSSTPSPLAIGK